MYNNNKKICKRYYNRIKHDIKNQPYISFEAKKVIALKVIKFIDTLDQNLDEKMQMKMIENYNKELHSLDLGPYGPERSS